MAKYGDELPSARKVRTMLQTTGRVVDRNFNMAAVHFAGFVAIDSSAVNGICKLLLYNFVIIIVYLYNFIKVSWFCRTK